MSRETRRPPTLDLSGADVVEASPGGVPEPPLAKPKGRTKPDRAVAPPKALAGRGETGPWLAQAAYPAAFMGAALWAGTVLAFVFGYEGRVGAFSYAPFRWVVAAAVALLPAAFMLLFAFTVRQGARLAQEASRARSLARDLTLPAGLAAAETTGLVNAVRAEIASAAQGAVEASRRLTELREALALETKAVGDAALQAERSARTLSGRLQAERADLGALATQLGVQTQAVTEGMTRHAQLLSEAAETASGRTMEAEALLGLRAQELLAAAGEAGRAAEEVGGELAQQTTRLHHLAGDLRDEREDLTRTADGLLADEEALSERMETRRARSLEAAADARAGADAVTAQAAAGAERLNRMIQEAAATLRVMGEEAQAHEAELDAAARQRVAQFAGMVAEERGAIEGQTRASLDRVMQAAQAARHAAEEAGETMAARLEAAAEIAEQSVRRQMDDLGEAAFTAGQQVDQVFDVRLVAARRTIETSATLVEEAGVRSAARVEAGLAAMRDAVGGLQSLLSELDLKLSHAPEEATARAAQVSAAMERGVEALVAAARRAADEAQTLDAAFHERLRRNAAQPPPEPAAAPPPSVPAPRPAPAPAPAPAPQGRYNGGGAANGAGGHAVYGHAFATDRAPPPTPPAPPLIEAPALRPRLKLTPTREDEAVRALFEPVAETAAGASAAGGRPPTPTALPLSGRPAAGGDDGWSWRDLLTTLNDGSDRLDEDALASRLLGELETLGVDAEALLPPLRTEDISRALARGEAAAARESVRRLAPSVIRRLSRRVATDSVLRDQADQYRAAFGERLLDATRRDGGEGAAGLLASEAGRAWLLFDAAAAERPQARN